MKNGKSHKLLVTIIILLIVLILLVGFTILYFSTDFLKGSKELFFNYIAQVGGDEEGFYDSQLMSYLEAKDQTPYENNGVLSFNITNANGQQKFENVNNMNITFSGKVNNSSLAKEQNININYSEEKNIVFPLKYKRVQSAKGIQTDYVGSKYIVTQLNTDESETQPIEELEEIENLYDMILTKEDVDYLEKSCISFLDIQSDESSYSKIQEVDSNAYRLTLSGEEMKSVMCSILEMLKSDEIMLQKLNFYIKTQESAKEITSEDLQDMIDEINDNTELSEKTLEITVYQNHGNVNKLTMKSDNYEMNLLKTSKDDQLKYDLETKFNINNQPIKITLNVEFLGLQAEQNVNENYTLTIETSDTIYNYNYKNDVKFIESTNIDLYDDASCLFLDDMQEDECKNLISAIKQRILDVNSAQMEELGVTANENPLQYVIPQLGIFNSKVEDEQELDEMDVNTFNSRFENYESTNLQGVTVKGLLTTISLNNGLEDDEEEEENTSSENKDDKYLIKEIHFDGTEYEVNRQNISSIKSSIETESYYRVEFEKNEDTGIIYRVVINKK